MRTYSNSCSFSIKYRNSLPYPQGAIVIIPTFLMENWRAETKALAEAPQSPGALASEHHDAGLQ